jgi:hypothetical protein
MATLGEYREFFLSKGFTRTTELPRGERLAEGECCLVRGDWLIIRYREFREDAFKVSLEAGRDGRWIPIMTILSPRDKPWSFAPNHGANEFGGVVAKLEEMTGYPYVRYFWSRGISIMREIPREENGIQSPTAFGILSRLVDAFLVEFCPG